MSEEVPDGVSFFEFATCLEEVFGFYVILSSLHDFFKGKEPLVVVLSVDVGEFGNEIKTCDLE